MFVLLLRSELHTTGQYCLFTNNNNITVEYCSLVNTAYITHNTNPTLDNTALMDITAYVFLMFLLVIAHASTKPYNTNSTLVNLKIKINQNRAELLVLYHTEQHPS